MFPLFLLTEIQFLVLCMYVTGESCCAFLASLVCCFGIILSCLLLMLLYSSKAE